MQKYDLSSICYYNATPTVSGRRGRNPNPVPNYQLC